MPPTVSQQGPPASPHPLSNPLLPVSIAQQAEHDLAGPSVPQWASACAVWNKSPALSAHSIELRINPLCISKSSSPCRWASKEMLAPHPLWTSMLCSLLKNPSYSVTHEGREPLISSEHICDLKYVVMTKHV